MNRHTPGPWKKYGRADIRGGTFTVAGEAPCVGTIANVPKSRKKSSYFDARSAEEMEANACLIAAAPEMYAVLKAMESVDDDPMANGDPRRRLLLAAIAKAEGRP